MPFENNSRVKLELRMEMISFNIDRIKKELKQDRLDEDEIERRLDLILIDINYIKKVLE